MPIRYIPPSPQNLRDLKDRLNYTGNQMADMFGLAGNNQWRKYTHGVEMRPMSLPMLFLAMAMQDRSATVEQVLDKCRALGAVIEFEPEPTTE